jgi:hypothetical protein
MKVTPLSAAYASTTSLNDFSPALPVGAPERVDQKRTEQRRSKECGRGGKGRCECIGNEEIDLRVYGCRSALLANISRSHSLKRGI